MNVAVICGLLLIVSALAELELIKYLSSGIAAYTYACVCLRERAAYYGSALRLEDNKKIERALNPFLYWTWVILIAVIGVAALVTPLITTYWRG